MIKKILAATTLAVSLGVSGSASAIDLNQAFNNLTGASSMTTTQAAQVYKSAARTSMDLGGVQMRVPRSEATLFSITPPSISASCAGISAHFGGISFISGSEIQTLIQHIEQGIPGAVLQLAIKLLCPQCEAVLQAMEKLAQDAAKMAIDSCHVSSQIVNAASQVGGLVDPQSGATSNFCAQQQAKSAQQTDSLMAELSSACSTANSSLNSMNTWINSWDQSIGGGSTPAEHQAAAAKAGYFGNVTWNALSDMGYCAPDAQGNPSCSPNDPNTSGLLHTKLVLMNLLGTEIITAPQASNSTSSTASAPTGASSTSTASSSNSGDGHLIYPPNVTIDNIYDMLMCGAPVIQNANSPGGLDGTQYSTRSVMQLCGPFWKTTYISMQLYDCDGDYAMCGKLKIASANANSVQSPAAVFTGPGFIFQVTKLLTDAAVHVANNQAWDWNSAEAQQLAALVSAAPFPLYQAINAAAVYPAAAADLLDSMGLETAELMVYTIIGDMMSPIARPAGQAQVANAQAVDRLYKAMGAIRTDITNHERVLGGQIALQEALSREIVQINQTIQRQVLSDDFLGNTRFATALFPPKQQ